MVFAALVIFCHLGWSFCRNSDLEGEALVEELAGKDGIKLLV
jgi:hypothetical protein